MANAQSRTLLLFGATGDLSKRMLLPSLYALHCDGLIAADLRIMGTARSELDDEAFRAMAGEALAQFLPEARKDDEKIASFLKQLSYQPLDASKIEGFAALAERLGDISGGMSIFLSTAPFLFTPTIQGLKSAGLAGEMVRIGLEKPLGNDLASSCAINDAVAHAFPEDRTFRIDHYLGKETVQNLLALRFANMLFEPVWKAKCRIDSASRMGCFSSFSSSSACSWSLACMAMTVCSRKCRRSSPSSLSSRVR